MRILGKGVGTLCLTTLVGFASYRRFYVLPFDQKVWLASKVSSENDTIRRRMAPSIADLIFLEHPSKQRIAQLLGPPDQPEAFWQGGGEGSMGYEVHYYLVGVRPARDGTGKVYISISFDENDRAIRASLQTWEPSSHQYGFGERTIPRGPDWSDFFGI